MKKIMIIGAGLLQSYVIKRAKELGYATVVVDKDPEAIGFKYADYAKNIDIIDKQSCLEFAREMQIDGVLTAATDYGVLTTSYIARELNLNGLKIDTAKLIKNKFEVRKKLSQDKNNTNQYFFITSLDDIEGIKDIIKYPLIVKPCDGSGSKGVSKVTNIEELKKACKNAIKNSLSKKILLETFVTGKEYGVESFVYKDKIYILGIMEKIMTKEPNYAELGHTISYNLNDDLRKKIETTVKNAIKTLNIDFGSVNMDIIVTNQNDVCIIDIGARMGGNLIGSHIIPMATGIDYMGNIIKASLGENVDFENKYKHIISTRLMDFVPGKVKTLPDLSTYYKDQDVKYIVCKLKIGDKINTYKNNLDGCGYVVVSNNDVETAKKKALKIKEDIDNKIERIKEREEA